ncbi:universal stress protein [Luteibaculum oceani]|uniref:Universal stress protein n=1 Tax=Luteibaculum oceani TaxID=1294296 RepID=A0A5C6V152_9FLAO|nr:universal stress protein [Luteibaculum oceani]TXC78620.1 universal stress protein [Luteibaculum oceani]
MKHIVIPTKSFEDTLFTFRYAKMWYGIDNVQYRLLNAFEEPSKSADMVISIKDLLHEESKKILEEQKKEILNSFPDAKDCITTTSIYGEISEAINRLNQQHAVDTVVMATTGAGKLKRFFGGSNTAKVVANVSCPVLSVPYKYQQLEAPTEICLCLDYETIPQQTLLTKIKLLANSKNCKVTVLHIDTPKKDKKENLYESEVKSMIALHLSSVDFEIKSYAAESVSRGILEYVKINSPSLLVMIAHPHNYLQKILNASQSKLLTNLSNVPLLVYHE